MTISEEWKNIDEKGFEGYYQVSNLGRVRSVDRLIVSKDGRRRLYTGKVLIQKSDKDGYKYVILKNKGKSKTLKVHRLVGEYFVPNPYNKPFINHLDESKDNNVFTNLEWVTPKENANYGTAIDRARHNRNYEEISRKQLNDATKSKPVVVYKKITVYPSIAEAERQLNLSESSIRRCCHGTQDHVMNYIFRYKE